VNYYIKHLVVDCQGNFSKATEWTILSGDPKIVCHPLIAMTMDIIWSRIAFRTFLHNKVWLLFEVIVFVVGVSAFEAEFNTGNERIIIASCRLFTYVFSMCPRIYMHVALALRNCRNRETISIALLPVPRYLKKWQELVGLMLTIALVLMLMFEPILACIGDKTEFEGSGLFTQACPGGVDVRTAYAVFTLIATFLFFSLTVDLAVFSTRVSAFVLICFRVVHEALMYVLAMAFIVLTFSCAIASLRIEYPAFDTIPEIARSLMSISLMMYDTSRFDIVREELLLTITVVLYVLLTVVFLVNLLIAQLNCAYSIVFQDMVGFARLSRGRIVVEAMPTIPRHRWEAFVASLKLDQPCQFGVGDMGMPGAIQVFEPAAQNIVTVDMIRRFGGTTSPLAQWPEEEDRHAENDRFSHMERLLEKAIRRMAPKGKKGKGGSGASSQIGSSSFELNETTEDSMSEAHSD